MSRKRKYEETKELKFPIGDLHREIKEIFRTDDDITNIITTYAKPRIVSISAYHDNQALVFDNGEATVYHRESIFRRIHVKEISVSEFYLLFLDTHGVQHSSSIDKPSQSVTSLAEKVFLDDMSTQFYSLTKGSLTTLSGYCIDVKDIKGTILSVHGDKNRGIVRTTDGMYTHIAGKCFLQEGVIDMGWTYVFISYLHGNNTVSVTDGTGTIREMSIRNVSRIGQTNKFTVMLTQESVLWAGDSGDNTQIMISEGVTDFMVSWDRVLFLTNGDYWLFNPQNQTRFLIH